MALDAGRHFAIGDALTSSGCNLQKSAIWSKVSDVLSSSQTAVAFGISGASDIF
jgi:hypothetical protein